MARGKELTISAVMSVVAAGAAAWPAAQWALAGEITRQVAPLIQSQQLILQSNVDSLRTGIAALEFKRDMCAGAPACWSVRDNADLAKMRADIEAYAEALRALQK